ncbi:hypothetical protein BIWAKO_01163 [Bosea sp. BIWAKO-01]|nr:hypothetical protein BIWAKO_01163 [Bosea sp. BIWAKO-01]
MRGTCRRRCGHNHEAGKSPANDAAEHGEAPGAIQNRLTSFCWLQVLGDGPSPDCAFYTTQTS